MTQSPPPGWYTDPSNGTGMRWWDGQAWSMNTMPMPQHPVAAPPVAQPVAAPSTQTAVATATSGEVPSYGATPAWGAGQSGYPVAAAASSGSAFDANRFAFYTFGVVALYVVLALTTRVVLIGVIPIMMSIRSLNAREKLAPIALVAAIVSVGIAFAVLSGH